MPPLYIHKTHSPLSSPDVSSIDRKRHPLPPRSRRNSSDGVSSPRSRFNSSSSLQSLGSASSVHSVTDIERALELGIGNQASLWNQLGNAHFRQGAYELAERAYKRSVAEDDAHAGTLADAYNNLGAVYWSMNQIDSAIAMLGQARSAYELLAVQEASVDRELSVAGVDHQLGLAHCLQGQYGRALEALERARQIRSKAQSPLLVSKTLTAMARVHRCRAATEDLDKAVNLLGQALQILRSIKAPKALTLTLLADIHLQRSDYNLALNALYELLREYKAQLAAAQAAMIDGRSSASAVERTLLRMADIYTQVDRPADARQCRQEAMLVIDEAGMVRDL